MQKYDVIERGIAKNDVQLLREAIGNMCYINQDFSNNEFFEVIEYVEKKGIELKDKELKGKPTISSQKSEFEEEDFTRAVFELKNNFCDERIKDVETIGKKLYGKKAAATKPTEPNKVPGTNPNQSSHQKDTEPMVIRVLVVAAIIAIVIVILLRGK